MSLQQKALAHWDVVNLLARRRFSQDTIAEEAALFVLESLKKNNWKKLQQFSNRSSFKTFFTSVVYRLLEDYSRKQFGRLTPPKWIREAGGIWLLLFRLLCMERYSFLEAVHLARERKQNFSEKLIDTAAETILGEIPDCGKEQRNVEYNDEYANPQCDSGNDNLLESKEKRLFLNALGQQLLGNTATSGKKDNLSKLLQHSIKLNSEEKILLKLCCQENYSVTEAGKKLGLNRFQAHGRLRRTLTKLESSSKTLGMRMKLSFFTKLLIFFDTF